MDIVDLYLKHESFKTAVRLSGLPVHVAHVKLLQSGALKIQDKIQCGSKAAALGGGAEELFHKLVPDAVDPNKYFQKNNPIYDFMFGNLTIDVKYSSLFKRKTGHSMNWQINTKGDQDFIVAFLERERGAEMDSPYMLLLPMAFINVKKDLYISRSVAWFNGFQVEPEELRSVLKDYSDLREAGHYY